MNQTTKDCAESNAYIYQQLFMEIRTCIFRASCYSARLSLGASSDLVQPFRPKQIKLGLGWEESRLPRYDIRAVGPLPSSINSDNESTRSGQVRSGQVRVFNV